MSALVSFYEDTKAQLISNLIFEDSKTGSVDLKMGAVQYEERSLAVLSLLSRLELRVLKSLLELVNQVHGFNGAHGVDGGVFDLQQGLFQFSR